MNIIGLDIGGAHLKIANSDGRVVSTDFEIWKAPDRLRQVLGCSLDQFAGYDLLAVTMTAELADCFETKLEGIAAILDAVESVADGKPVFVWQTGAEFVTPDIAREIPLLVAAANWHALSTFVGRLAPASGALLVDVGSTTTDIVPLQDGVPVPDGFTDRERLELRELLYMGVERTPLCALTNSVPFRNGFCPIAAELFATTRDVYLLLGALPEDPQQQQTANGKPATRTAAHDRLARMLCCDRNELSYEDAELIAQSISRLQKQRIADACELVVSRMAQPCETVLVAGAGSFLAREVIVEMPTMRTAKIILLEDCFSGGVSEAACAFAVARLAAERLNYFV